MRFTGKVALSNQGCRIGVDRHVHGGAHAKAEQNAFLHPGIHAPSGFGGRIRFGGANLARVQRLLESLEELEMFVGVGLRMFVEQLLDLSLHARSGRPADPSVSSTFSIFARLAGLGGHIGSRHTGSSNPISAIAAFTGIGFDSTKFTSMSGKIFALQFARAREIVGQRALRRAPSSRAGISLDTTETTPWPPSAISGIVMRVVAGEHREVWRHLVHHRRHLTDIAGGFLDADDVVDFREPLQRGRLDVHAGAALHAVDNDGKFHRRRDRFVVLVQAFLRRLVVIRRDGENAVDAHGLRRSLASSITSAVL